MMPLDLLYLSAPIALPLLLLLLGLLLLRRDRAKKANRMLNAENDVTGATTTNWEALNGPMTLSDMPAPRSFEAGSGKGARSFAKNLHKVSGEKPARTRDSGAP